MVVSEYFENSTYRLSGDCSASELRDQSGGECVDSNPHSALCTRLGSFQDCWLIIRPTLHGGSSSIRTRGPAITSRKRQHETKTCHALRVAVPQYLSCAEYLRVYEAK